MNGFQLLAEGFKKLVEDGQCNAKDLATEVNTLEFLGTCSNAVFSMLRVA